MTADPSTAEKRTTRHITQSDSVWRARLPSLGTARLALPAPLAVGRAATLFVGLAVALACSLGPLATAAGATAPGAAATGIISTQTPAGSGLAATVSFVVTGAFVAGEEPSATLDLDKLVGHAIPQGTQLDAELTDLVSPTGDLIAKGLVDMSLSDAGGTRTPAVRALTARKRGSGRSTCTVALSHELAYSKPGTYVGYLSLPGLGLRVAIVVGMDAFQDMTISPDAVKFNIPSPGEWGPSDPQSGYTTLGIDTDDTVWSVYMTIPPIPWVSKASDDESARMGPTSTTPPAFMTRDRFRVAVTRVPAAAASGIGRTTAPVPSSSDWRTASDFSTSDWLILSHTSTSDPPTGPLEYAVWLKVSTDFGVLAGRYEGQILFTMTGN